MPIPSQITFVTFDVYGTLIDWETGAFDAFSKEATRDGFTIERDRADPAVPSGPAADPGRLLRALRRGAAAHRCADRQGARLAARAVALRASCPSRSSAGRRSRRPTRRCQKIAKKYSVGLISNIDDKLLGQTRRHIPTDFDLVVTAQQVRSYKPDPAHFTECERRIGGKKGWVHIAASYYHDIEPCLKKKIPVIWVNRTGQVLETSQKKPDAEVKTLREAAKLIGVG